MIYVGDIDGADFDRNRIEAFMGCPSPLTPVFPNLKVGTVLKALIDMRQLEIIDAEDGIWIALLRKSELEMFVDSNFRNGAVHGYQYLPESDSWAGDRRDIRQCIQELDPKREYGLVVMDVDIFEAFGGQVFV